MSPTNKHTPGPWHGWFKAPMSAGMPPAAGRVLGPPWSDTKELSGYTNEADVCLMIAAPDLLAALKALVKATIEADNIYDGEEAVMDQARAAIAKAEGRCAEVARARSEPPAERRDADEFPLGVPRG